MLAISWKWVFLHDLLTCCYLQYASELKDEGGKNKRGYGNGELHKPSTEFNFKFVNSFAELGVNHHMEKATGSALIAYRIRALLSALFSGFDTRED